MLFGETTIEVSLSALLPQNGHICIIICCHGKLIDEFLDQANLRIEQHSQFC